MKSGWHIIGEDTRKHTIRLEYSVNLGGYWLYLNGYLVEHIYDIDDAIFKFMELSNKWNGEGFYFLSDFDNDYTGDMFDIDDYIIGIYPYTDIRKRLSVGSLSILVTNKVV